MTIHPSDQESLESRDRIETTLCRQAEHHYKAGLKLNGEGRYEKARSEFLEALRLRPDYPEVVELLTAGKRIQAERYALHIVQAGESLSEVAQKYYDDPNKFPVIAQYNDISDVTRIQVGQEIRIPEIEGIPFLLGAGSKGVKRAEGQEPRELLGAGGLEEAQDGREGGLQDGVRTSADQVASHRDLGVELFVKGQYREAIAELTKALSEHPEDEESLDFCSKAHFEIALTLFEQADYLTARTHFETAMEYGNHCEQCASYMDQCETLYKEHHYKAGMEHYGKEQLVNAIREWELVNHIDPAFKRVSYLIALAKTMLKNLVKIKQEISNH